MLCKYYKRFAHIFAKHQIPMKREWRTKIYKIGKIKCKDDKLSELILNELR